jgi:hypothetical protein
MVYNSEKKIDVDQLFEVFEILNERFVESNEALHRILRQEIDIQYLEMKNQNDVLRFAVDKFNQDKKDKIAKNILLNQNNDQFQILRSCHLKKNRNIDKCYQAEKTNSGLNQCYDDTPAYCDRILYTQKTFIPVFFSTEDGGGIEKSSHRAIFGIFEFL